MIALTNLFLALLLFLGSLLFGRPPIAPPRETRDGSAVSAAPRPIDSRAAEARTPILSIRIRGEEIPVF